MTSDVPFLFDRETYLARRRKATDPVADIVAGRVAEELGDRLMLVTRQFSRSLIIADRPAIAAEAAAASGILGEIDIHQATVGDALPLPESHYGAIISFLDLQCVNDVPGHLIQLARALVPDGLLMVAFFAADTLFELRDSWLAAEAEITGGASPRVAPMIGVRELGGLLQRAGLALPVADLERVVVRYDTAFELMREIKNAGYANPLNGRSRSFVSRRFVSRVADHYQRTYSDGDGRIRATLEIAWANAWKPHPSQQQPLKPGSAKARLADALKVREEKL